MNVAQITRDYQALGVGDRLRLLDKLGIARSEITHLAPHEQLRKAARLIDERVKPSFFAEQLKVVRGTSYDRPLQPQPDTPTREALIELCDRGLVPQEHWYNRDSAKSQRQLGEARQLLLAGCAFELSDDPRSDVDTWWVTIYSEGFNYHELGAEDGGLDVDLFYLPTAQRIERNLNGDWY